MSDLDDEIIDDEDLSDDLGADTFEIKREIVQLGNEPLFSKLMKRAVAKLDPDDKVLQSFVEYVVPNISLHLADKTAKGGDFARAMRDSGKASAEVDRYGDDQSMRAHLINGLLPVLRIAKTLRRWGILSVVEQFDDVTQRLFLAGFTLHDWLKLPFIDDELKKHGLEHHTVNPAVHLGLVEDIFRRWCVTLGLDRFLEPLGALDEVLHHLIIIASNTQIRWGVMHDISKLSLLAPRYRDQTNYATHLSTLADYLAYLGRTPVNAVEHDSIQRVIALISNRSARLAYHHVADVRGVITNIIHNATLDLCQSPDREPLLYAPTGVVYLERIDAKLTFPDSETVATASIQRIRETCGAALLTNLTGFARDGKGLKYAPFYDLFFPPSEFPDVVIRGAYKKTQNKASAASTRFAKLQATSMLPSGAILPDIAGDEFNVVDMLAEGLALLEKIFKQHVLELDAQHWLLQQLAITDINDHVTQIPQLGNTGGVPYQWYYAAGVAFERNKGLEPQEWQQRLEAIARAAKPLLPDVVTGGGWDELRKYIAAHLRFSQHHLSEDQLHQNVAQELKNYSSARRTRQATMVCSLCSSAYTISQQREAGIPFAPMVYSNKLALHGSKATRNICDICGMEMMLRQLLMNRVNQTGKKFEARRLRYLYFYPMYFFTPETLDMINEATLEIQNFSITELREALMPKDTPLTAEAIEHVLDPQRLQKLDPVFFDRRIKDQPQNDRWLRMHFSERNQPMFSFIGMPPAPEAKDAEAWVKPVLLSLLMPLLLDVKVVASESLMPIINEANEIPETVLLDSPHAFIPYLIKNTRLNYDQMIKSLQTLIASYMIHLDGNSKTSAGFDYVWNRLPALARDLDTSPLYAFAYLKRWQRRAELDSISPTKATLYLRWFEYITQKPLPSKVTGGVSMKNSSSSLNHAYELVHLYRQFYRHASGKRNSNSILKPISIAAETLLDADSRMFATDEALITAIRGSLQRFIDDVSEKRGAEGTIPKWISSEERQAALHHFAEYWVANIYRGAFDGDLAAMRGKQLNLLKGACEVLYLDQQAKEWKERGQDADADDSDTSDE